MRALAREVFGERDPAALFTRARPVRLEKRGELTLIEIDLPHAVREDIDVTLLGDELLVRVRDAQRRIALPASMAGRAVDSVRLNDGVLEIGFEP